MKNTSVLNLSFAENTAFHVTAFCLLLLLSTNSFATNYTWNGSGSSHWATSANWTPNGIPTASDNVTIVSGTNQLALDSGMTVNTFTITSGTFNLGTYTITINSTASFTSGTINNGTVSIKSTATTTFSGTVFGASVTGTSNSILLNGSTFNSTVTLIKKGAGTDNGSGGNTFGASVTVIDSGTGSLTLGNTSADVFNSTLSVTSASTGPIYIAHNSTGNQFNGDVTFSGGYIYSNYYGTATYNGNIVINSASTILYFSFGTGSVSIANGKSVSIGGSGLSSGSIYFRNFTQLDSTQTWNLTTTGTTGIYFKSGSTFKATLNITSPKIYLDGSRFLGPVSMTETGSSTVTGSGGNYFAGVTTITNNNSSATYYVGYSYVDTFLTSLTLQLTAGNMTVNHALYQGNVTSTNSGSGILTIANVTCNGTYNFLGSRIALGSSTFNNTVSITKTTTSADYWNGGNVFNSTTLITDSATGSHSFSLAQVSPDAFNGNVTFRAVGTGVTIYPASSYNSTFGGNIYIGGTGTVSFGITGGKTIFNGSGTQTISKLNSIAPAFKRIQINKPSGVVTLSYPMSLSDTLFLTNGVIHTDSTNLLTVPAGKVISGGSDGSYITGPLKKIGNTAFCFPVGDSTLHTAAYHPVSITAPTSSTDAFTAQFFARGQTMTTSKDDSLGYLSTCEYWYLTRNTGTSQITPKFGWNTSSCCIDSSGLRVAYYNSTKWICKGNGGLTGCSSVGTIATVSNVNNYGYFLLASPNTTLHMSYELPPAYPSQVYSACFHHDYPTLTTAYDLVITLSFFQFTPDCHLNFQIPQGSQITGFSYQNVSSGSTTANTLSYPISYSSGGINIYPQGNFHGDLILYLRISGCEAYTASNFHCYANLVGNALNDPQHVTSTSPCPNLSDPPNQTICFQYQVPKVSFMTLPDNTNFPTLNTISSQYNKFFLKYDELYRYYVVKPSFNSGIVDYFTLDINPEPDVTIEAIDAVKFSDLSIVQSFGTATHILFDPTTINTCVTGPNISSTGQHPYMVFSSNSANYEYILIREKIKVTKVLNCDEFANDASVYTLRIHCDHMDVGPGCAHSQGLLNVNCKVAGPAISFNVAPGTQIPVCASDNDIEYTIEVHSGAAPVGQDGSGTVELTGLSFNIDPEFFAFDYITVGATPGTGITLNNGGLGYTYNNNTGLVTLDLSYFNNSSTGLNNTLNPYPPISTLPNPYNYSSSNKFIFFRDGTAFYITLWGFHFQNCSHLAGCGHHRLHLSDFVHIDYRTMCEMNLPFPNNTPSIVSTGDNFIIANQYVGAALPDIVNNINTVGPPNNFSLAFTSSTTTLNQTPWSMGGLMSCANPHYVVHVNFPYYYSLNTVQVIDPVTLGIVATITPDATNNCFFPNDVPQFDSDGNPILDGGGNQIIHTFNNYDFDISGLGLTHDGIATIILNLTVNCGAANPPYWADKFSLEFREICGDCLPSGAVCTEGNCYTTYSCADWTVVDHCGGDCCQPLGTDMFDNDDQPLYKFERKTYGWADETAYIAGTPLTYANYISSNHLGELKKLYECDLINAHFTGVVGAGPWNSNNSEPCPHSDISIPQLYFDLSYVAPPLASATVPLFNLEQGVFHFTFSSGCMVDVPVVTSTDVSFPCSSVPLPDLTGYVSICITPDMNFIGGTCTQPLWQLIRDYTCTVSFDGDFRVTDAGNLINPNYYSVPVIGSFMMNDLAVTGGEPYSSCDPPNINVLFFKTRPVLDASALVGPGLAFYTGNSCQLRYLLQTRVTGGIPNQDDFPYEYRPMFDWEFTNSPYVTFPANEYATTNSFENALVPNGGYNETNQTSFPYFPGAEACTLSGGYYQPNILPPPVGDISSTTTSATIDYWQQTFRSIDKTNVTADDQAQGIQKLVLYLGRQGTQQPSPANGDIDITNLITIYDRAYSDCKAAYPICTTGVNPPPPCAQQYVASTQPEIYKIQTTVPIGETFSPILGNINPITVPIYLTIDQTNNSGYSLSNMFVYFTGSNVNILNVAAGANTHLEFVNGSSYPFYYKVGNSNYNIGSGDNQLFDGNGFAVNSCNPTVEVLVTFSFTCSEENPKLIISYGNSCDGYHMIANPPAGVIADFSPYIPCYYKTDFIEILPQTSALAFSEVPIDLEPDHECEVYLDFTVASTDLGAVIDGHFSIEIPTGFTIDPSLSSIVAVTPSGNVTYTGAIQSPFNLDDLLPAGENFWDPYYIPDPGTYFHFHIVYQPVCVSTGEHELTFTFDNIGYTTVCGEEINNNPSPFNVPNSEPFIYNYTPGAGCPPYPGVIAHHEPCNGMSNGTITVSSVAGATYSWSPSGGSGATATGLSASTTGTQYCCTITAPGCSLTVCYTLYQPANPVTALTYVNTSVSCPGGSNGQITVTASGGTPFSVSNPYFYSWSPSGGATSTASGLSAGTYIVTVTDGNGCTATASAIITEPDEFEFEVSSTSVSCHNGNDGTASVIVTGGTPAYNYSWSPSGGTDATATGLYAGNYTVTVTDENGCTASTIVQVTQPQQITFSSSTTATTCNAGSDGTATISDVQGGTPYTVGNPYHYLWSPSGGTNSTATGLAAGNYTCVISDYNGCTATAYVTVSNGTPIDIDLISGTILCHGGVTNITSFVSGGTGPYQYLWNDAGTSTTPNLSNVPAGSYTVSVTNANGCTSAATIIIDQPSAVTAGVTAHTNVSCYGGSNGTATASGGGGTGSLSYSWSGGAGTNSTASNLAAGNYTVTVTDANGCSAQATVTITQPTQLQANSSISMSDCESGIGCATITGAGGTAPYSGSGLGLHCDLTAAGSPYTFQISDANNCTASVSVTITADPLCHNYATDFNPAWTGVISGSYNLNSSFTLAGNLDLQTCTLAVAAGVSITVTSGHTLTIEKSSHLFGCCNMWEGIIVQPLCTLKVDDSRIEDAEYAVEANNRTRIQLNLAKINRNLIGLYVPPDVGMRSISITITRSSFTCAISSTGIAHLKPAFSGQYFTPLSRGFAGLYLFDLNALDLPLTGSSANANVFDNLTYGIYSHNTNVTLNLRSAIFNNMTHTPMDPYYDHSEYFYNHIGPWSSFIMDEEEGTGIYSEGNNSQRLVVRGHGIGTSNAYTFSNCHNGIITKRMGLFASANRMKNVRKGVSAQYGQNSQITIAGNIIAAFRVGIELLQNNGAITLMTEGNTVNIMPDTYLNNGAFGIMSQEYSSVYPNHYRPPVIKNHIDFTDNAGWASSIEGIYLNNAQRYNVGDNTVDLDNQAIVGNGIHSIFGPSPFIHCNTINGHTGSSFGHTNLDYVGIHIQDCIDYFVKCNYVDQTDEGFRFAGTNWTNTSPGGTFESNSINSHGYGLHVMNTGVIGEQDWRGNKWNISDYEASFGSGALGAIDENPFYINDKFIYNTSSSGDLPNPISSLNPGWFQPLPGTESDCGVLNTSTDYCRDSNIFHDGGGDGGGPIISADLMVAKDSVHSEDYDEVTVWKVKRSLIGKLLKDTSLITADSLITDFYSLYDTTNIKAMQEIDNNLQKLNEVDSTDLETLKNSFAQIDSELAVVGLNDSIIFALDTLIDLGMLDSLLLDNDNRFETVQDLSEDNQALLTTINDGFADVADNIKETNDDLSLTKIYEENERSVNDIYLRTIAKGLYNLQDFEGTLWDIASQCPYSGGPAVYKARGLYYLLNDTVIYDDRTICSGSGYRSLSSVQNDKLLYSMETPKIYPNPADDKATLVYRIKEDGIFEIYNTLGEKQSIHKLNSKAYEYNFDTSKLIDGVYYYKVICGGEDKATGKLVITR
jgi:hypothetical protein